MYTEEERAKFKERFQRWKAGEQVYKDGLPKYKTDTLGDTNEQQAVQEWGQNWQERMQPAAKSKVVQKWNSTGKKPNPESSEEYTKRRINEETKRTWLSDAADISHAIGETALAIDPKTAIPYFGAKVGTDILNGTVGTHTILDAVTPFGAWGANYINPNSLLNRNIRTALYNNKIPYGYNILDINIPKSFIEGSIEALAGREIKQLAKPKWFGKSGNVLGNTTEASSKPLTQMQENHRAAAWARYLGLNDNLQGVGYIPSRPGWVTKQHDPYFKKAYADAVNNQLKSSGKLKGSISDKSIYNTAGGMGYEVNPATNIARVFDIWDLQPFKKLNIPGIKNFEVSQLVPGAKPFNFEMFVDLTR